MLSLIKKIISFVIILVVFVLYLLSSFSGSNDDYIEYEFRNESLLNEHYEKHGSEMNAESIDEYVKMANEVINNPNSLHKLEAEDGDDVYYLEESNELVIVSTDGYIRTYFMPDNGKEFFDKQ